MSLPRTEGWYDDPDSSDAERYFDGQGWTPRRRRKEAAPKRASQASDPYGAGPANPSASGPYFAPPPAGPPLPYDAYASPAPPDPYGAPPPSPELHDSYGSAHQYGQPRQHDSQPPRLQLTMVAGMQRTVGLLIAGCGLALAATSFAPWGQIRKVDHSDGSVVASTVSFPGIGEPKLSGTVSDGLVNGTFNANSPLLQLRNTNPGWIALVLGVAAIAAGAALLWVPQQRKIIAISVAVLGGVSGVLCVGHLFDLRATFDNPPNLADENFSPGGGLIASIAISFAVMALGVWACAAETRSSRSPY